MNWPNTFETYAVVVPVVEWYAMCCECDMMRDEEKKVEMRKSIEREKETERRRIVRRNRRSRRRRRKKRKKKEGRDRGFLTSIACKKSILYY